jgi:hypothetical protein
MRERPNLDEDVILRAGSALLGLILLASAAVSFELAREHMAALGVICGGDEVPHCGWCYASVGFLMTGVATLIAAVRRAPAAQRI